MLVQLGLTRQGQPRHLCAYLQCNFMRCRWREREKGPMQGDQTILHAILTRHISAKEARGGVHGGGAAAPPPRPAPRALFYADILRSGNGILLIAIDFTLRTKLIASEYSFNMPLRKKGSLRLTFTASEHSHCEYDVKVNTCPTMNAMQRESMHLWEQPRTPARAAARRKNALQRSAQ